MSSLSLEVSRFFDLPAGCVANVEVFPRITVFLNLQIEIKLKN